MRSWRQCAVALAAIAFAPGIRAAADAPAVKLAPLHVPATSLFLGYYLHVEWDAASGLVETIVVTRVEPGSIAERAGLMAGDYLLAVDGKRAIGITQPQLTALMARSFEDGDTVAYKFTVGRGFLMRRREVVLRFKG
jgi:S1-C subfamily serine protease